MNASENISLLKQIKTDTSDLTNIDSTLTLSNAELSGINLSSTLIRTKLDTVNANLDSIETDVSAIKTDVDTLAKTKVIFNARLTDGSSTTFTRSDYSDSGLGATDFYWQNDKGTQVYITRYRYVYADTSEPTSSQLYHGDSFTSKIGALNSAETDYEAPYITVTNNKNFMYPITAGGVKQTWISDQCFVFQNDFIDAPIEIGVSRKFGHYMNHNMSGYDGDPIGIVDGYYFSS